MKEIINELEKQRNQRQEKLNKLKHNINSNYELAKLDFVVVENLKDSIEILTQAIKELEKLQERIIKRNKGA